MRKTAALRAALAAGSSLLVAGCGPVSAAFHDPSDLPALAQDLRVRYGTNARAYATEVAKLLPGAMARVEAAHGRPFGKPFVIAAFLDDDAYAAANGSGSAKVRGVAFFNRVTLSPKIWREEPGDLEAYLTHELSHEHLISHLSALDYFAIPSWFLEGLAVTASDGGGAQRVSVDDAECAILAGRFIDTPEETTSLLPHGLEPPSGYHNDDPYKRMHMAYRQAGLFVAFLSAQNPTGFKLFMDRLLDGGRFKTAFEAGYGQSVGEWRSRFLAHIAAKATATE